MSEFLDSTNFAETSKSDFGLMINVSLRLLLLGGIVFLATTYIPETPPALDARITISVVVILVYSLIDLLGSYFFAIKDKLCQWICGCGSDSSTYDLTNSGQPSLNYNLQL
jgi:hypothetical protein